MELATATPMKAIYRRERDLREIQSDLVVKRIEFNEAKDFFIVALLRQDGRRPARLQALVIRY